MFASAAARGLISSGVAATGKHFPGHGDTHVDSHLALPVILKTMDQLRQEELVPFNALIKMGIPCIMTGHMALPLITGSNTPCSLSREITTTLLRDELGFQGVIVTDCLEMDAIAEPAQGGCGVAKGALLALQAGADVVMICHTFDRQKAAIEKVYEAIKDGHISLNGLTESGKKIAVMKEKYVAGWKQCTEIGPGWEERYSAVHARNLELSSQVYLKTATVIWNADLVIPLDSTAFKGEKRMLLLTPLMESVNRAVDLEEGTKIGADGVMRNTAGPSYQVMAREMEKKSKTIHIVYGSEEKLPSFEGVKGVVFVMRNADQKRWQLEYLARLNLKQLHIPVVLVSSCGPYDLDGVRSEYEKWTSYVATFEFTAEGLSSAVSQIFK